MLFSSLMRAAACWSVSSRFIVSDMGRNALIATRKGDPNARSELEPESNEMGNYSVHRPHYWDLLPVDGG
jgi:hypothetical protein